MIKRLVCVLLSFTWIHAAEARPEQDKASICYVVKNNKQAGKYPCIVTEAGGAGTSVLTYQFNKKKYQVVSSYDTATDQDVFLLNDKPVIGYMRNAFFDKTDAEADKKYFCYKQKIIDFCAQQPD